MADTPAAGVSENAALLIRAILGPDPEAVATWQRWARASAASLDDGAKALLPLAAARLSTLGARDALVQRGLLLRHVVRTQNTARFREAAQILRLLQAAGLDTLVLKGLALATRYYPDPGLRPMVDVDVMVPVRGKARAIAALEAAGWVPQWHVPEATFTVLHSLAFRSPAGREVDLHWHVLVECCHDEDDEQFWAAAVETEVDGVRTKALCPTDLLFHLCVHGIRSPVRWIVDAAFVIRAAGSAVDWSRLVALARERQLILPVTEALGLLASVGGVAIPAGVLAELRAARVSWFHRVEHSVRRGPPGLGGTLPRHLCQYWRHERRAGLLRAGLGLPRYLQLAYGLQGLRHLPVALTGKVRRQVARAMSGR